MSAVDDLVELWALAEHADLQVSLLCALSACVLLTVVATLYVVQRRRPVYLLNYSVYKPPDSWKITHDTFIDNSYKCGVRTLSQFA
jgi:3-ketoacyl-CoA synthase